MITRNLYEEVLMKPARSEANALYIVSGYASAAFATDHLEKTLALDRHPTVRLLIGMFPAISNLRSNHLAFQELSTTEYPTIFECRYVVTSPPVHAKAYAWYRDEDPVCGFIGSANYSNNAFTNAQREAVTTGDAVQIKRYFDDLWDVALDCRDPKADKLVEEAVQKYRLQKSSIAIVPEEAKNPCEGLPTMTLSLLTSNGEMHKGGGGLNWGQRPGRNPNQSYIPITREKAKTDFFPPLKQSFTVTTDDGKSLICVRAQPKEKDGTIGQAIETTQNNSYLGIYFRNRLGLASGAFVTKQDLLNYGRTDVLFCKIDDENYFMDFSKA